MSSTRIAIWLFPLAMTIAYAGAVFGQGYPNKPIRIVTSTAGGSSDFTARLVAPGIAGLLGQPVIIDNRSSGLTQAEIVSRAVPDGYNLLMAGGAFLTFPLVQKVPPYDPVRDFAPITQVEMGAGVVFINPSVPVKSVKELIALAKARPGELNYGASGRGGSAHLAAELLKSMAGVNMVYVPFKSTAQAITSLLANEVQVAIYDPRQLMPLAQSGKLRALAVTSAKPYALAPELPTVAASLPGYEAISITGLFAPAKTPAAIIARLNQEVVRYLRTPEAKEAFLKGGVEVVGNSPEQFAAAIKGEIDRKGKLIKDIGLSE